MTRSKTSEPVSETSPDHGIRAFESTGFNATHYKAIGFDARIPSSQRDVGVAKQERHVEFNSNELVWEAT